MMWKKGVWGSLNSYVSHLVRYATTVVEPWEFSHRCLLLSTTRKSKKYMYSLYGGKITESTMELIPIFRKCHLQSSLIIAARTKQQTKKPLLRCTDADTFNYGAFWTSDSHRVSHRESLHSIRKNWIKYQQKQLQRQQTRETSFVFK